MYRPIRYQSLWTTVLFIAFAGTGNIAGGSDLALTPVAMRGGDIGDTKFQGNAELSITTAKPRAMPWIPLLLLSPDDSGPQPPSLTVHDAELLYEDWEIPFNFDGSFATLKKSSTEFYYWHTWGETHYKYHGPLDDPLQTLDWVKTASELINFNGKADPVTDRIMLYTIYKRDNGDLLGFCHIEKYDFSNISYPEFAIGLIYSTNNGDDWTYGGEIIRPQTDTENIGGVPYLVVGDYFYVYFNERPINSPDRITGLARANLNDVLNAAASGNVTSWKKFNSGTWIEDGLMGVGSNILPVAGFPYDVHSDAAYDRTLNKYMLTVQTHNLGQLLLYTSNDGINWKDQIVIDETDDNNFIQAYSFFAGTENSTDDCREVGSEFYIFFPRKDWPDAYHYDEFYRRFITFE